MPGSYQEIRPSPRLARYVECYWFRQDHGGARTHRVLPDGCVDILLSTRRGEAAGLTVVGLMTAPLSLSAEAGRSFFGVRFRPGMASAFVPEAAALTDRIEPLDQFWGSAAWRTLDQLVEASTPQEMAAAMESSLRPANPPGSAERALWQLPTAISMDHLAADASLSARQLRRVFLERAGVPPKYLSRILRFRKAAESILTSVGQPSWAQFAVACGYYDQAHFIREFQEFSGMTPDRFLQYQAAELP